MLHGLDVVHRLERYHRRSLSNTSWSDTEFELIEKLTTHRGAEEALAVRLVHLDEHASIGSKRNVAAQIARGEVLHPMTSMAPAPSTSAPPSISP